MNKLTDKYGYTIQIDESYIKKLNGKMPPIGIRLIEDVLKNAEAVKVSTSNEFSRCYYKKHSEFRWYKVVVKYLNIKDEHWISTGHLTDGIRESEDFNENSI